MGPCSFPHFAVAPTFDPYVVIEFDASDPLLLVVSGLSTFPGLRLDFRLHCKLLLFGRPFDDVLFLVPSLVPHS